MIESMSLKVYLIKIEVTGVKNKCLANKKTKRGGQIVRVPNGEGKYK